MKEKIKLEFAKRFGEGGTMYASSGRINLIGEHTDYNGGFVFPGAIDKCIADLHDMVTLSCKLENQQANLEYAVKHIDRIRSNLKIHIGKVTDLNDEIRDVLSDFVLEKHQSNNNE